MKTVIRYMCVRSIFLSSLLISVAVFASTNVVAAEEEHEHEESEEEIVQISTILAEELGIGTELVGDGVINRSLLLYGRTMPDPQGISHVYARYPGMIVSMAPLPLPVKVKSFSSLEALKVNVPVPSIK